MTFRIGSDRSRSMLLAALLGSAMGCSSRSSDPAVGAAPASTPPAATPADSGIAQAPTDMRSAPAPADTAAARPDSMMREAATADSRADSAAPGSADQKSSTHASAPAASPAAAGAPVAADTQYLKFDPATKTVTFRLVAGPFSFNGFTNGGGTLTVPPGSNNVWNFVQDDGTPHSAEVASGTGPIPNAGGDPAIPRAYTNKVVEGLVQGATDVIKFTAPDTGSYRIICGVPGHALSGMWIWLKIDPAAKTPTFGPTPK